MKLDYSPLLGKVTEKNMLKCDLMWFAGVNGDTISRISKGELITRGALKKICNALHCDVSEIFRIVEWDDVPEPAIPPLVEKRMSANVKTQE